MLPAVSDDDDFNPDEQVNSRMADAVATFGLNEKAKHPPEPEATKPATKKSSATSLAAKAAAKSNSSRADLSNKDIIEMQQRGELEVFADLLGECDRVCAAEQRVASVF